MSGGYLAEGFADVDRTGSQDAYYSCLALLDSLPHFIEYKRESYDLLRLGPGMAVLEAGCGLGNDALRMAERVMPGGRVVAVDSSAGMIEKARSREAADRLPVRFQTADVKSLPFPNGSFARCRIDRVLQHVPQPEKAVTELARVLEPGGLLLAYDNDWSTFSVASDDRKTTRLLENFWCGSFTNPRINRDLPGLFATAGLSIVENRPLPYAIADFDTADKVYNLRETASRAAAKGLISEAQGRRWLDDLAERSRQGGFNATLTAWMLVGRK